MEKRREKNKEKKEEYESRYDQLKSIINRLSCEFTSFKKKANSQIVAQDRKIAAQAKQIDAQAKQIDAQAKEIESLKGKIRSISLSAQQMVDGQRTLQNNFMRDLDSIVRSKNDDYKN